MAGFSAAIATFSSCDKAGSIPLFTAHLEKHPNDYLALMWRARAYGITKQYDKAKADVHRAISVSDGGDRMVAEAHSQHLLGNSSECVEILRSTIKQYPKCSSAWSDLGGHYFYEENYEEATPLLSEAIKVAKENGETKAPWHSWDNYMLGQIFLKQNENVKASAYFRAAIKSCPNLTVAHLGLCVTNIYEERFTEAKVNFSTAQNLNPTLVEKTNLANVIAKLPSNKEEAPAANVSSLEFKKSGGADGKSSNRTTTFDHGGGARASSRKDDETKSKLLNDVKDKLEELEGESPCVRKRGDRKYIKSKCGNFWYSKDTARHGGAAFKRYKDTRSRMEFMDSVDANLKPMTGKHESREGTSINKKDTSILKGKD